MTAKRRPGRALCMMIGAQALALGALAQPQTAQERTPPPTSTTQPGAREPAAAPESGAQREQQTMDQSRMKPVTPESFASQAAQLSAAEIEMSKLAAKNTKNEQVRLYAERLIKDHTAANEKLSKIAAQENMQLPQKLDAKHEAEKQKLSKLQGDAFDREYKKEMMKGHDQAIALFQSASQTQQMPQELRQFAASTLPTLERHQEAAESLNVKEGGY